MPKVSIEPLTDPSGWTGPATAVRNSGFRQFSASFLADNLIFELLDTEIAVKSFAAVDVTDFPHLALNLAAVGTEPVDKRTAADFRARIRFIDSSGPTTLEYFLPLTNRSLDQVRFENTLTSIDSIEIEALADITFFASEVIAYRDELPLDIYSAMTALMEKARGELDLTPGFKVKAGTITGSGSTFTITGGLFLDKDVVVTFGGETHRIKSVGGSVKFDENYFDGATIGGPFTDEQMFLFIPINTKPGEEDVQLPSVGMEGGFTSESAPVHESATPQLDSYLLDLTVRTSFPDDYRKYTIDLEGIARTGEPLEKVGTLLEKSFERRSVIWINGRRHEVGELDLVLDDFGDATEIVPRVSGSVEVTAAREAVEYERQKIAVTVTTTVTSQPPPV